MKLSTFLTGALTATLVAAHPGHDVSKERHARRSYLDGAERRDLSHCAAKLKERGIEKRNMERRAETAAALRKERGFTSYKKREQEYTFESALNTSHLSTEDYSFNTPADILFAGNNSCVLSPEVILGPYYVAGEYIRTNLTESQVGVPARLEFQILDVETCDPIVGAYAEIWTCNATGVYSGVSAEGNGNSDTVTSNLNETWLRGVQPTGPDGTFFFDTQVPGHYDGRTNHVHVIVHLNATAQANGTLMDTTVSHIGQAFFDQDLLDSVEALDPYTTNTQVYTKNFNDTILADEADGSDPIFEYVFLGDDVADGIFGWLAFGVNTTYSNSASPAAYLYETGGVVNDDFSPTY